jgi:hypothetical protein
MSVIWDMVTGEWEIPATGETTAERGLPEHGFEMPRLMERIEERPPKGSRPPLMVPLERGGTKKGPVVRH